MIWLLQTTQSVIALCNGEGIAKDNDERMVIHARLLLERGLEHGMEVRGYLVRSVIPRCKGHAGQADAGSGVHQDDLSDMGLNSTGGLSNNSNGMPKAHPSDHGLCSGSYGYDAGTDLCNRKPERSASDGDHQVL